MLFPFWHIRRLLARLGVKGAGIVEFWVVLWIVFAVVSLVLVRFWQQAPDWVILVVGFYRVAEIVIELVNVLLFDLRRTGRALRGFLRSVILVLHNYVEILIWFAVFYVVAAGRFYVDPRGLSLETVSGAFYYSMLTMTTLGYGNIFPGVGEWVASALVTAQTLIGVFLALVVLARVVMLLPRPRTIDEDELVDGDDGGK